MGNWKIEIEGLGIHDNGRPDDVEALAADFVEHLKAKGQRVDGARVVIPYKTHDVCEILAKRDPK